MSEQCTTLFCISQLLTHAFLIAVLCWMSLQVPGFGDAQWAAFIAVFRVQVERMLHLIDPVWRDNFPVLWQQVHKTASEISTHSGSSSSSGFAALVCWCSVLLQRAAFHSK